MTPHPVPVPTDEIGAFVGAPTLLVAGRPGRRLSGTTLAVKDVFDVAGTVTGAGNPTFATGRPPARASAEAVRLLVDAGASIVGKTVTDELAYSLAGTNVHHGTPVNVAAPGRTPGGSSAGSAAAVAANLADLALGTDTGGSIRVPASSCGIYGWRPTHGAVPVAGVVPLAPSFDTVGLLARGAPLLAAAADALLGDEDPHASSGEVRLVVPAETLAELPPVLAGRLVGLVEALGGGGAPVDLGVDLDEAVASFRTLQGAEAWRAHGPWITRVQPRFGPGIAARFAAASQVTATEVAAAQAVRDRVSATLRRALWDGTVLVLPAAAGAAPRLAAASGEREAQRIRTLRLTCLAGLGGLPVVVAPLLEDHGHPLGVAFVAAPGSDRRLLAWASERLTR